MNHPKLRLAILDMYNGIPNQGMRCIQDIVGRYEESLDVAIFDVRGKAELPNADDFDIYISTGGPGSPFDGDGHWDKKYYKLIDQLWNSNLRGVASKKYVFFICHSFQMACIHFDLGNVIRRKSMSFGTFPIHLTDAGLDEPIFQGLDSIFWGADFRYWQFIQPDLAKFNTTGVEILALEKVRPHVPLERAVMAIRFSDEFIGVQFHPEADADGMLKHFRMEEKWIGIVNEYGKEKYASMIKDLSDPRKIAFTNQTVLPNFLNISIEALRPERVPAF